LGTTSDWECEPKNQDELECVVEWEPIDSVNGTLKNGQESKDNPIGKPLGIIRLANAEQGLERVVSRNHESSNVCKELAADVEENEEEIGCDQSEEGVDFRDRGLFLQVVQGGILRKLLINLVNVALGFVLEGRHDGQ